MEVETIADCLNVIDDALVEGVNTIGILESIHRFLVEREHSWCIEERIALRNVLKRINDIIDNYNNTAKDVRSEYIELRRLILVWIIDVIQSLNLTINDNFISKKLGSMKDFYQWICF